MVSFLLLFLFPACLAMTRFRNIAPRRSSGDLFRYRRAPSHTHALLQQAYNRSLTSPIPFTDIPTLPWWTNGQPGVAVGDFNGDGVDDIYVTNGPGRANSLFINEFKTTGRLRFRDRAREMGIGAVEQDSTGVCYGDLDGDGGLDLVVLSEYNPNKVFLSKSEGGWEELDWKVMTGDGSLSPSTGCALGDVNGDGRLDLFITSTAPRESGFACLVFPYQANRANQLFINEGKDAMGVLKMKDVSLTSGINDFGGDVPKGSYTITWAAVLVDVDGDGHLDVVVADDQCGVPVLSVDAARGANRGGMRIQYGDGTGKFRSVRLEQVEEQKNNRVRFDEDWMSVGLGDFNCDGKMDLFGSNAGDYHAVQFDLMMNRTPTGTIGKFGSRWWTQTENGWRDAAIDETGATVFGWGNAVCDYDNDGDQAQLTLNVDIFMVGSLDFSVFAGSDNPNVVYRNDGECSGRFSYDFQALPATGTTRSYQGLALGDFNLDGYPDLVAAAGYITKPSQRVRYANFSSPLDNTAFFTPLLSAGPDGWTWTGNTLEEGDMMVAMNRPRQRRCFVSVLPVGTAGLLENGKTNRGALGAIVRVKVGGGTVTAPVCSGDSFGSQHSARRNFGLGRTCKGVVQVVWPDGLVAEINVAGKELITVPEVPCDVKADWTTEREFRKCVADALQTLVRKRILTARMSMRIRQAMGKSRAAYLKSL